MVTWEFHKNSSLAENGNISKLGPQQQQKILADVQFWVILSKPLDFGRFESSLLWFPSFNRIVVDVPNPNSVSPPPITKVGK